MKSRKHIIVKGRVQGVFFRYYTHKKALELGVFGSVKNLTDGSVEIKLCGDPSQVESFISWCFKGSPAAKVTEVIVKELEEELEYREFAIIR